MNGTVAVLVACAIGLSGYIGYGLGQVAGWREFANIRSEKETLEWAVDSMMRPLWSDMCRAFPEKCLCRPKREL